MFKKKALTLPEIEALEVEKINERAVMQSQIDEWTSKRQAILKSIAESIVDEDEPKTKTAREELRIGDEREKFLKTEIEIVDAYLQTFSKQKDRARGVEIEKLIPRIQKMDAEILPLVNNIYEKMTEVDAANQKLLDYLKLFDELEATRKLNLKREFISLGVNGLSWYAVRPGVASDPQEIPMTIALVNAVCDRKKLEALINTMRSSIANTLDLMRDHSKRLGGDEASKPNSPYCPNCYTYVGSPDKNGKASCSGCNKTIEPVW